MNIKSVLSNNIIIHPQYVNKTLNTLASDSSGLITYGMNQHGYRASKPFNTVRELASDQAVPL